MADHKERDCSGRSSDWKSLVLSAAAGRKRNVRVPFYLTDNLHEIGTVAEIMITGLMMQDS